LKINLKNKERKELQKKHKKTRDKKVADRIKAVLLRDRGWSQRAIAASLLVSENTVHQYLLAYKKEKRLKALHKGSEEKLNRSQRKALKKYLTNNTFTKTVDICAYVLSTYKVDYSVSGMREWLDRHGFTYKKYKPIPAKANKELQEQFQDDYLKLTAGLGRDEVLEFGDGVHPTMQTKLSYGWIRRGHDKLINTTASRT